MSKFQILWNYTRKKNGEIVIAEEELQKMLDMAEKTAYNEGFMDGLKSIQTPVCHPEIVRPQTPVYQPGQMPTRTTRPLTGGYQVTCADHEGQTVAGDTAPLTAEAKNQMVHEFDQNVNGKTEYKKEGLAEKRGLFIIYFRFLHSIINDLLRRYHYVFISAINERYADALQTCF